MRLIDVDKLIEDIEKLNLELFEEFKYADSGGMKITSNAQMYIICESVLPRIKEQPTAFDVEQVLSELEKSHFHTDATFDDDGYCNDDSEEVVNLNEAIEIVRRGGMDEERS